MYLMIKPDTLKQIIAAHLGVDVDDLDIRFAEYSGYLCRYQRVYEPIRAEVRRKGDWEREDQPAELIDEEGDSIF
jgi:hypothetical protein